jgi:hypothetical protein
MQMANPRELLDMIDRDRLKDYLGFEPSEQGTPVSGKPETYTSTLLLSEPYGTDGDTSNTAHGDIPIAETDTSDDAVVGKVLSTVIQSKVLRLGDFVDTDAVRLFPLFRSF